MIVRRRIRKNAPRSSARRLIVESLETRAMLAATVQNFKNVNLTNPWADITESVAVGSDLFLVTRDPGRANLELWKTNGTTAGTARLANLGPSDGQLRQLTNVDGMLYFRGYDATEGSELWKSNGTVSGTVLVRSLKPGSASATLTDLTNFDGTLFFSGNGELYKSDGTSTGTTRVKDLVVGASDEVSQLETVGNALYLTAKNPAGGVNLYQTTGTSSGTSPAGAASGTSLSELTQVGSRLYFVRNGNELWKLDQPSAAELAISTHSTRRFSELVNFNGTLFFSDSGILLKSDGTSAGTVGLQIYGNGASELFVSNNILYFSNGMRDFGFGSGYELWRSDGTESGTFELKDINPRFNEGYAYSSYPNSFVESSGRLYFLADDGRQNGLWSTDGTSEGTTLVESALSRAPVDVNGKLFFAKLDGTDVELRSLSAGQTTSNEVVRTGRGVGSSNPSKTVRLNGSLYFFANDGVIGQELRRRNSDGSVELVADISPGAADTTVYDMESANGLLYFTIGESLVSQALWRSDGTSAGTFKLANVAVTHNSSDASAPKLVPVNDSVYFSGLSSSGEELWKSDGTVAGTVLVKDIYPGTTYSYEYGIRRNSSKPAELININGTLFFAATDSEFGRELWKSDGTTVGTVLVKDANPGTQNYYPYGVYSSNPVALRQLNGKLHYMASDRTGMRFWESDGTEIGTAATSLPIPDLRSVSSTKRVGDKLFLVANGATGFGQLWTSDGTTRGTVLLKDIRPGNYPERIGNMTELDGVLYFTADDGVYGNELWKSNGTRSGTVIVRDVRPGLLDNLPANSNPAELTAINGVLFFTADDGRNGRGLWRTNGTSGGATRIAGNGTSNASRLFRFGSRLLFSGSSTLGQELFQLFSAAPALTLDSTRVTYTEGQTARVVAPNSVLMDADSSVFHGGRLTVSVSDSLSGDELRVIGVAGVQRIGNALVSQGVVFGTVRPQASSTTWVFDLNANATVARTQRLIQSIAFRSVSQNPLATVRTIQFTLLDGESGLMRKNVQVTVVPVNDVPTLTGLTDVSYQRNNSSGVAFASGATVTDLDSANFDGGQLNISVVGGDSASNRIYLTGSLFSLDSTGNLRRGTIVIGTVATGAGVGSQPFVVQFNSSVNSLTVTELLKALRFGTSNSSSNQGRFISLALFDGDGAGVRSSVRVSVAT